MTGRLLSSGVLLRSAVLLVAASCGARKDMIDRSGEPHMRPAEQGAASAIYFMLRNPGTDPLVLHGVEVDVAGSVTLHRSMDQNDMSSMTPLDSVIVPPGDSVPFVERGLHIMASDMHTALKTGDTVVVRLRFRPARVDTLRVPVRE